MLYVDGFMWMLFLLAFMYYYVVSDLERGCLWVQPAHAATAAAPNPTAENGTMQVAISLDKVCCNCSVGEPKTS